MVSLGNVLVLARALDFRSYSNPPTNEIKERVVGFRSWAISRYEVRDAVSPSECNLEWVFNVS